MNGLILLPEITKTRQDAEFSAQKQHLSQFWWPKGTSGNPAGRPKGTVSITEAIKRKLLEVYPDVTSGDNKEKRLYLDKLIESIMKNAIEHGETRSQKDIWSYMDGAPKQTLDIGADKDSLEELTGFFRAIGKRYK